MPKEKKIVRKKTVAKKVTRKKAAGHKRSHLWLWALAVFLIFALAAGGLAWNHSSNVKEMGENQKKEQDQGPLVDVAKVERGPQRRTLILEGEARPYFETTLYAKVSGYLKNIYVDEGSIVKSGQILGVVNSPETDQSYLAAKADAINKTRVANRYKILIKQELVAPQEAEQAFAQAKIAQAILRNQAQLKEYELIRAPFDGVVTERFLDPGDLVGNASNSRSNQLAIVTVSDVRKLKVAAYVDQKYAPMMRPGWPVQISLTENDADKFPGFLARVSGTMDARTRMLLVEMDFDNSKGKIVSGSFVHIQTQIPMPGYMTVPVETLVTENGKPAVAEIMQNSHLKFHTISIAENDGTTLSVSQGVQEGERLAKNIGVNLKDGDVVRIAEQNQNQNQNQNQGQDKKEKSQIISGATSSGGMGSGQGDEKKGDSK